MRNISTTSSFRSINMKMLFLYPMIGTGEVPLNLSYLVAVARERGAEVRVFDTSEYSECSTRIDTGQTSVGQFRRFGGHAPMLKGASPEIEFVKVAGEFKPDIICMTALTNTFSLGLRLLKEVKKKFDITTLVGGVHSTLMPEETINETSVDMICVGEGEGVIQDLCDGVEFDTIKNLWYKENEKIIKNPLRQLINLDDLPFQDFDDYKEYNFYRPLAGKLYRSVSTDVSRGCPFRCSYCVNHVFQKVQDGLGQYHRVKSIQRAIGNLIHLKKYRPELVRFWDEDFTTLSSYYLKDFLREYKKEIELPYLIYARVDTMTEEKVCLLKDSGCITVAMGIESGNKRVREEVLNRKISDAKIKKAFQWVRKAGIRVSSYNMIGLPHEDRGDIFDTIELNRACKPDSCSVAFLEPYKHTKIFDDCVEHGYIKPEYIATFDFFRPHISEKLISHKELKGILCTFMLYVKAPRILWPIIRWCESHDGWIYGLLKHLFGGH